MLTKIKNIFCKPFSRPVAVITLGIAAVLIVIPLLAFLVLIFDWLNPMFSFVFEYLPPGLLFYALLVLLPISYFALLLQNHFSEKKSSHRLLKRVIVTTVVELAVYFLLVAWWKVYWP